MLVALGNHIRRQFVGYVALFVALGGGAVAATGGFTGADGKIHGCVGKDASLTVVKPGKSCTKGKTKLVWNQIGPRGSRGLRGLQGLKGDAGPGAISIPAQTYGAQSSGIITSVHGFNVAYACAPGGSSVTVEVGGHTQPVYVSGVKTEDTTVSALSVAQPGYVTATGTSTANLDAIVMLDGIWNRVDLGGYAGGSNGCNIWGLVIPGT